MSSALGQTLVLTKGSLACRREVWQRLTGTASVAGSQPWAALLSHSLQSRRSRHRGIQAVCMAYKKPSGAPSWDCSHLSALFPCKMLLTVLHQGQFILNGMYRHSIHLYFLPSLLFHSPHPLAPEVIYGSERGSHFLSEGKKRADGFKEKPSIIGENIWLKR